MLAVLQQFNLTRKQTGFFLDFVFAIKRASLKTFLTIHPYFYYMSVSIHCQQKTLLDDRC